VIPGQPEAGHGPAECEPAQRSGHVPPQRREQRGAVEAVVLIAGQQAECGGGAQQPGRAVGLATFPLGEFSGAETAVGEMLGEVEVGDRSHELADPEADDHPNHAPLIRTRGQRVAGPTRVAVLPAPERRPFGS
jgi:hypothetical protein